MACNLRDIYRALDLIEEMGMSTPEMHAEEYAQECPVSVREREQISDAFVAGWIAHEKWISKPDTKLSIRETRTG